MPILVTNPMLRASHNGGQKGADEETDKGKPPTKGKSTFTGEKTPCYMFNTDELNSQPIPGEQDAADSNPALPGDEKELCTAKRKVKERKDHLWQLLLQRNTIQGTPTILVVAVPCFMPVPDTNI